MVDVRTTGGSLWNTKRKSLHHYQYHHWSLQAPLRSHRIEFARPNSALARLHMVTCESNQIGTNGTAAKTFPDLLLGSVCRITLIAVFKCSKCTVGSHSPSTSGNVWQCLAFWVGGLNLKDLKVPQSDTGTDTGRFRSISISSASIRFCWLGLLHALPWAGSLASTTKQHCHRPQMMSWS